MRILRIRILNTDANPFFGPFIYLLPTVIAPEHFPDTLVYIYHVNYKPSGISELA
jgi:hypothetical protein